MSKTLYMKVPASADHSIGILEMGCLIDASHNSDRVLSTRILDFAEKFGYRSDEEAEACRAFLRTNLYPHLTAEGGAEVDTVLSEASESAVGWLNTHVAAQGWLFEIDESSLFLRPLNSVEV
jgi:hypothetical protein